MPADCRHILENQQTVGHGVEVMPFLCNLFTSMALVREVRKPPKHARLRAARLSRTQDIGS